MSQYSPLSDLAVRQDALKRRMLRNLHLERLAVRSLERALTVQDSDTRDQQLKQASAVAIPTMRGIGEFASDSTHATVIIGSPPAEMLARWASQQGDPPSAIRDPQETQPLGLPEPPALPTP